MADDEQIGLVAANGGQNYDLNDGQNVRLLAWDGLSVENIQRLTQRTAAQRGATDVGFAQGERVIGLEWGIWGNSMADYYAKRRLLQAALYPNSNSPIRLTFTFGDGRVYAAEGNLEGTLAMAKNNRIWKFHRVDVAFRCGDPRLFDPTPLSAEFAPLATVEGWEVPWFLPWFIAASNAAGQFSINYADGEETAAPEYPVITLTGPIDSPRVENVTTGQVIDLGRGAGLSIAAGQTVIIDLKRGIYGDEAPTIRTAAGVSVDSFLTTDSQLNEWHLAPAGELLSGGGYATGVNVIALAGNGGSSDTKIRIDYYNRYVGL